MDLPTSPLPRARPPRPLPPPAPFPPAYISPPSSASSLLPEELTAPDALRVPVSWRCGTCAATRPVLELMTRPFLSSPPSPSPSPPPPPSSSSSADNAAAPTSDSGIITTCCATPSLQAVYDQFGHIYLFWRDDPAVADLRDPRMAREARRRVWSAGGACWDAVVSSSQASR
ncbi:1da10cfe-a0b5-4dc0-826a-ae6fc5340e03 [Thermothielavioides terrestris]|nr:1da10cfe-a0b5-4dc0-826a-ae6fc5340e03 [Thermothielavioides terrestris]